MKDSLRKKEHLSLPVMRGVSLILAFISTKYIISGYGLGEFAEYSIVMSLYSINSLLDMGLGNQLINQISKNRVSDKLQAEIVRMVCFNTLIVSTIVLILLLSLLAIIQKMTGFLFFDLNTGYLRILIIGMILTSTGRIFAKGLLGRELNFKYGQFDLLTSILVYSAIIVFSQLHVPLALVILVQTMGYGLTGIIMIIFSTRSTTDTGYFPKNLLRNLVPVLRKSRTLAVLQTLNLISFQLDTYFISIFCSSRDVAEYAVTWRIFSTVFILTSSFMTPIWARSARFYTEYEYSKIVRMLNKNLVVSFYVAIFSSLIILFAKEVIFKIFTNSTMIPSDRMIFACSAFLFVYLLALPLSLVMNAIDEGKFNLCINVISGLTNIFFTLILLRLTHSNIAALSGSIISLLLFFCIPSFIFLRRKLR